MNALPVFKPQRMTVGEFLDWPGDGTDTRYELVGGEPVAQAACAPEHSTIQANLAGLLFNLLRDRSPCRPLTEGGIYKSKRHYNYRSADLFVTCTPPGRGVKPDPIVVFEVLSPSNRGETLAKLLFYAEFETIREVVFVDSERVRVTVYRRGGEEWTDFPAAVLGEGDTLQVAAVDIAIPVADIYRLVAF